MRQAAPPVHVYVEADVRPSMYIVIRYEESKPTLGWNQEAIGRAEQERLFSWIASQPQLNAIVQAALAASGVETPSE